jgi:hypothetical protein
MKHHLGWLCVLALALSSSSVRTAASDIVIHASDVSHFSGMTLEQDGTAADGVKLSSADNGWSSTEQPPPASTAPVARFNFYVATPGDYRVWLRLKGTGNSKWNESVWVQFSNALRNGTPVYRWGTSDALLVNLEDCWNCGIDEWGWQDNAWWLNQSAVVTLTGGAQYLYVSLREDGVEFDQIVLSPATYMNSAPGTVKNDTTLLPSTQERITIQQGSLTFDANDGRFATTGSHEFEMTASVFRHGGGAGLLTDCEAGVGCPAGTEVEFGGHWTGLDVTNAEVSYRGTTYDSNHAAADSALALRISGRVEMPPQGTVDREEATATANFEFGEFFHYVGDPGEPTGFALLSGGGTVTFTLWWSTADQSWYFGRADFTFIDPFDSDPTPDTNEIVLYAADVATLDDLALVSDSAAAGGMKITSTDSGRQWLNTPPAPNDAPHATFAFHVPESGRYRVWLRLRGVTNSKWNESVWVQFSGATRNGSPIYQWGSGDALLVNLEDCYACGIQAWGWQDNAWWLNQSSAIDLSEGTQTLYVTIREDGVELDQIVLSRERFISSAPGPVKNDTTIVAKPVMADQVHADAGSMAFDGTLADLFISGRDGFSLTARFTKHNGAPASNSVFVSCGASVGCAPGSRASIDGFWLGDDISGRATYRGRDYDFGGEHNGAAVQFRGFVTLPPAGEATASVSAPFSVAGTVYYSNDNVNGNSVDYVGGGHATFHLTYSDVDQSWYVESASFDFTRPSS